MNIRVRKNTSIVTLTAAVAVAVLAVSASPVLAASEGSLDAKDLVPAFGKAQTAQDLPAAKVVQSDPVSVLPKDSLRTLGSTNRASYFTALGPDGKEICLVVAVASSESVASVCTSRPNFKEHGLSVRVLGNETKGETPVSAYLLPADVDLGSSPELLLTKHTNVGGRGANLIEGDETTALPARVDIPRNTTARPFVLEKIG